ncbi:PH domain-containing protein [Candidatus Peregrinibacteria bacterium]|nr:PH domain-containing protein [Candidatus Peregrinibacteria bacterium]
MSDLPKDFVTPVHTLEDLNQEGKAVAEDLSQTPRRIEEESAKENTEGIRVFPETDNTNRNFKGQQKNETVLAFTRRHWLVIIPHILWLLMLGAVPVGIFWFRASYNFTEFISPVAYRIISGLAIIGITYFLHACFLRFCNYYLQVFIVTNFRVIQLDQTLYFVRNRDSIDLREIQDIEIHQKGVIQTIFNYGELVITLSSAHATKYIPFMPNPEYFFRKINKTKREYIAARTLEKGRASLVISGK